MPRKTGRNTKGRIVDTAWQLFYEQGYDNTTMEDIVFASETSKGSFYHYFSGKDDLLGSLSMLFDEKYEELRTALPAEMPAVQKLVTLSHELFMMIDNSISIELLARLLSVQLVTAMSAEASDMSSYLLMGLPGLAYIVGVAEVSWTIIGLAAGTYLNFLLVSRRLRIYSEQLGAITVPTSCCPRSSRRWLQT